MRLNVYCGVTKASILLLTVENNHEKLKKKYQRVFSR